MKNIYRTFILLIALVIVAPNLSATDIPEFVSLVKNNSASVVNISTPHRISKSSSSSPIPGIEENSPLNEFLRYLLTPRKPKQNRDRAQGPQSLGSGFILSSDGYIVTNTHVIDGAKQILVRLSDQREFEAELIGKDKPTDIALLKIDEVDLPAVRTFNSDKLDIGQWVLAIGSPFGLEHTASQGIISGLGRNLPRDAFVPFIQTDVAINPGNSGGPLFDLEGRVIGVNSQIFTTTGGSIGVSFAIPINVALNVAEQLKTDKKVTRGWLGINAQNLTHNLAKSFGLKAPVGALISGVLQSSPADQAGLLPGDIIIEFNNKAIDSGTSLVRTVGFTPVDTEVPVTLIRDKEELTFSVLVKELTDDAATEVALAESGDLSIKPLKIKVNDLTEEYRKKLLIPENGVVVKAVYRGISSKAGIRRGDVIMQIGGAYVKNARQFLELAKELPTNQPISILIRRKAGPAYISLTIPNKEK